MNIVLNNPLETEAIAQIIGQKAQAGDVIVLTGDLGAGKTTMTKPVLNKIIKTIEWFV